MQRVFLCLSYMILLAASAGAYSYDDYSFNNSASNNQYQTSFQLQSYNSFSPKMDFFQFNFLDDFMKNPAYTAVVKGFESTGGLKDFLADKVAPNVNVQNFVGSEVKSGSGSVSFSASQNQFLVKSYDNVKLDSQSQIKQFDTFTSRGDFTQRDQVSQVQFNQDKLVTGFQVQTQDIAGNVCQQKVENIQFQSNPDGARYQNLVQFAQTKAEQPGTYGFDDMARAIKEFPEPAKQLPLSMDLTVTPPQGAATQMKISNMQWQQEKLVSFDAQIQQGKDLTAVSVEVKMNDNGQAESISLEANGNKQTIACDGSQSLEDLSSNILKGVNPVALLSGSDIQIGEGKVVYLAQNYNEKGQLAGGAKNQGIDYGKPGFLEGKASIGLKQDLKALEQTAPGITRDTVWNKNIKSMGTQQLTDVKAAITNRVEKSLEVANQQPTIKTAWGSTITKPADQTLKLENNRITSTGSFETPEGKLTNVTFKLQDGNLQTVSGTLTKPDNTQVMLGQSKKEPQAVAAPGAKETGGFVQVVGSFLDGVSKAIGSAFNAVSQGLSNAWQTVSNWLGIKTPGNDTHEGKTIVADSLSVKTTTELVNPANTRTDETTKQRQELGKALTQAESALGKAEKQIASLDKQNAKLEENTRVLGEMFKSLGYKDGSVAIAKDALYSGVLTDEVKARAEGIKFKTEQMDLALSSGDLKLAAKLGQEIKGMQSRFDDRAASVQKNLDARTEGAKVLLKEVASVLKAKDSTPEKVLNSLSSVYTLLKSDKITPYLYISLKQQLVSKLDGPNKEMAFAMLKNDTKEVAQAQAMMSREVKNIPEGVVKGDFAKPTLGGALGQVATYFTPAGPIAALRDTVANGMKIVESKGQDGKLGFVLSLAAIAPGVGEIKALPKLVEAFQAARNVERMEQAAVGVIKEAGAAVKVEKIGNYLEKAGKVLGEYNPINPGPLQKEIANTFRSATYSEINATGEVTLYRAYGGDAKEISAFWTMDKPSGPLQAKIDNALDPLWGNTATKVSTITIPEGTIFYEGYAAPQRGLFGGGSQVYIPEVKPEWLKK